VRRRSISWEEIYLSQIKFGSVLSTVLIQPASFIPLLIEKYLFEVIVEYEEGWLSEPDFNIGLL
jgi:hypothetical protein